MSNLRVLKKRLPLLLLFLSASLPLVSCGSITGASSLGKTPSSSSSPSRDSSAGEKGAVLYFSCTNSTKGIADKIAAKFGCFELRILPKDPYTAADLNYSDSSCRANKEQNDPSARPAIENAIDISSYSTVFLGYPIWWGTLPKIIYTLCDTLDFSGRTIIPFCTSGSSGIEASVSALKTLEPEATVLSGRRFASSSTQADVDAWIKTLVLAK
jgi:flavodoxin